MSGFQIPEATRQRQDLASRPQASAWVSANAGSGKTFVLSRRVVRLLLDGTDPSRILALTFTKAAAAEMATRVFKILGEWVTKDDADLSRELADIEGQVPGAARLAMARRLFARALETPGGLKIQTIHGFCEALLHQFPLEANVAGHFSVLDDRIAGELMAEAQAGVLNAAETNPDSLLGRALRSVIDLMSDGGAQKALEELIQNRDAFRRWLNDAGGLEQALVDLALELGISGSPSLTAFDARFKAETLIPEPEALAYAEALRTGTKTDNQRAEALAETCRISDAGLFRAKWLPIFLTAQLEPRKSLATKKINEGFPHVVEALVAEQMRLMDLLDARRALITFEGTSAVLRLAHGVIGAYEHAKTSRGYLDFEDLVVKTAQLLSRSDAAQWVQYKLDQGLDHILVDEAQDTSPRQWEVVTALAQEFFAGEGATERTRTVFAVGDEKQSIYSFQGAVPAYFDLMRRDFSERAHFAEHPFHSVNLQLSFRSTPDVLGAVDKVFEAESAHRGLSQEVQAPVHEAIRRDPGIVDLWPLESAQEVAEPEDWRTPVDHVGNDSPMVRVARRIAGTIRDWMREGIAAPGDVMILVRKRGPFVEVLNRELKAHNIPAAGSDRLVLTEHIAVQDLMALGRFLLLPEDDLSLACVLKSPLFELGDEDLFEIARETPGSARAGTLWQALVKASDGSPKWQGVRKRIEMWRARADFMPPFEFYARLLSADGGRREFRARLGAEVDDVLDEFLALTINYEQTGTPGLEGFLAWLGAAPAEIKRELTNAKGMVRIMTVHGSKGLESRFVILVDPGSAPSSSQHDPAFLPRTRGNGDGVPPGLVWLPPKQDRTSWHNTALAELRAGTEEEYRRLLYVALTRAEDRLVVCGWAPKRGAHDQCWYNLVVMALRPEARELVSADGVAMGWRWQKGEAREPDRKAQSIAPAETVEPALPGWLLDPAKPLKRKLRLQPSKVFETMELKEGVEPVSSANRLEARKDAGSWPLERGRLIHRLLELLPDLDDGQREEAACRYVETALAQPFRERAGELLSEIHAILQNPAFEPLFARNARAEVPVVGTLVASDGKEVQVSGQVDRLLVDEDRVLILDYKTNAFVPGSAAAVPLEYRAQLAVYRELLKQIYPGKTIEAALLWTSAPRLMTLSSEVLEETFKGLRSDGTAA
ncbi:double-strand break repair helicase AddA [Roseibium sp. RKSG952]|uniref:double-strand break repair helicase AddA n=1 Tax=Roseibium sp. RKSG952 TaxID=2529384 RepID=UPI0012BD73B0|nr:double-strand break repair helicase AddA [Roseibium sp. RKSG952]MTI00289.1 double-strand break repair helicase AddA [Roseibium sp. RKSG952]